MAIDKNEVYRRLSFIKYLFYIGIEQSEKPEPLCNTAILSFHDSVELFLQLACEHYGINSQNIKFMEYFDKIESHIVISQKESMQRFNKTRVDIKHYGILISKPDIDYFKFTCLNFFTDNTQNIFNINFNNISMINLITLEKPKKHLENAENEINNGDLKKANSEIALAFWRMIEEYEESKSKYYGHSPFFFGNSVSFNNSFSMKIDDDKMVNFVDDVSKSISAIQSAIKILSLGFDYRKFTKFSLLTPLYIRTIVGYIIDDSYKNEYNLDDTKWCFDFVIECCIKLQNFDYKIS